MTPAARTVEEIPSQERSRRKAQGRVQESPNRCRQALGSLLWHPLKPVALEVVQTPHLKLFGGLVHQPGQPGRAIPALADSDLPCAGMSKLDVRSAWTAPCSRSSTAVHRHPDRPPHGSSRAPNTGTCRAEDASG